MDLVVRPANYYGFTGPPARSATVAALTALHLFDVFQVRAVHESVGPTFRGGRLKQGGKTLCSP